MKNIIQETLKIIEKKNLKPEPRWKYLMKKYSFWLVFAAACVFCALFLSVAFYLVLQLDWDLYRFSGKNIILYFVSLVPFFWIFLAAAFVAISFFDLRKTETGYRFSRAKIFGIITAFSLSAAAIFFFSGLGKGANSEISRVFPRYVLLVPTKEALWSNPEEGFLAGKIDLVEKEYFDLKDLRGSDWEININSETKVRPSVELQSGEMVKIIGKKTSDKNFQAVEIRSWQGRGQNMGHGKSNFFRSGF